MKGTFLLPSLGRPEELRAFFKAYHEAESTCSGMVLVDHKDYLNNKDKYESIDLPDGWTIRRTSGVSMGDKIREVTAEVMDLDWVGILNDDHRPRTPKWDQKLLAHMTKTNIVSCNDGKDQSAPWNSMSRLAGAIILGGEFIRALGWIFPPGIHHFFSDDIWQFIGTKAMCIIADGSVCVEHEHAYLNPEKRDKTFYIVNGEDVVVEKNGVQISGGFWPKDRDAFSKWAQECSQDDVYKAIGIQPKTGVMIASPLHDGMTVSGYTVGLMDTGIAMNAQNIHMEYARIEGSSLLAHARNALVDLFLKSRCKKILFIDSDQGFDRNHVFTLLASARPIIAGVTPHKRFPMNLNFDPLDIDKKYFQDLANKSDDEFFKFVKERADIKGEIEVSRAGTGFFMIDRDVIETMIKEGVAAPYRPFDNNRKVKHHEFFEACILDGIYRGEDWYFCEMAKKMGYPIYINTHVLLSHHGSFPYQLDQRKRIS